MYGVGQSPPQRRGIRVILGVMLLALMLVGLFYAFYALVLKEDAATPAETPEPTVTLQIASDTPEIAPLATNTLAPAPATSTATATTAPTDTPLPSPTLRPLAEVITIGVRVSINISEGQALNLRDQPSLTASTVITTLVAGSEVDVTDGPEDVGDLRWWNVFGGEGRAGWVVEAFGGETWLVPVGWSDELPPLSTGAPTAAPAEATATATAVVTPTATPTLTPTATTEVTPTATSVLTPTATPEGGIPSPTVRGRARVTTQYGFINLRQAAGLGAETIGTLDDGTVVTILEGPEEADGLRWWRVDDGQGNVGWAAERTASEVLLVPIP